MEDSATARALSATEPGEFVVRQFVPVRIERTLLTRLFDLTTGLVGGNRPDSLDRIVPASVSTAQGNHGRKEAA